MTHSTRTNRRHFLGQASRTAGGVAGAGWLARSTSAQSKPAGANERIRLAAIGTAGQGRFDLGIFAKQPEVEVVAVCDVNLDHAQRAKRLGTNKTEVLQDYRKLLDRKDIDAFLIATPEHWHGIITIHGCMAGKDVYCEKPLSHTIAEGRRMVQAARKYNRIVQTGTQQHSGPLYSEARELIQSGKIGKVTYAYCWYNENRYPNGYGRTTVAKPPKGLDWDMWQGPRPAREYDAMRCSGLHRYFWDYCGGQMTDIGTHHMETIQWFMDEKAPLTATTIGFKSLAEDTETPDTFTAVWEYPGWILEYADREATAYTKEITEFGICFHGSDATMYIDRAGYQITYEKGKGKKPPGPDYKVGTPRENAYMPTELSAAHIRNFLDCIKSRKLPNADVEIGHRATSVCHIGNIAYKVGRKVHWDAEKEEFINDKEANQHLTTTYRDPYVLPEI